MAYDPGYYKEYYARRKEELLRAKKERYRNDQRYRSGVISRARVSSRIRTLKSQEQRKLARVLHNGKPEEFFYTSNIESVINRDRSVIDSWVKNRVLPVASYHDKRGRRLYSMSQVKFISNVLHKLDHGKTSMTYQDLSHVLHDVWSETFSERLLVKTIREVLHGKHRQEGEGRKVRKGKTASASA